MKSRILSILEVAFIAMFIFSAYNLITIIYSYSEGDKIYEESQDAYIEVPKDEDESFVLNLESLKAVNSEALGWIYIEDTPINYPVLQTDNNDYYLKQTYNRKYSDFGSIFLDYRCSPDMTDQNTLIYGHNTKNGSMFGSLKNYKDEEYFTAHPYIYLIFDGITYKYEVISAYTVDIYNSVYTLDFSDKEEFASWLTEVCASSEAKSGSYTPTGDERIITLSTCTSRTRTDKSERFVVAAKLIEEIM